ncbi:vacuolar-processing enzyme gamma-isozyme, partial [Aplysia californica]|uniref:Vacuolar-processing enzyme gamma-isozyme n=1 Tax=Aplysia californica TaxID=6500 RepID=A0ABM1ACR4_APLCA
MHKGQFFLWVFKIIFPHHQANACHAYQIFRRNGIPKEQIVLMMYDDVAYNHQNPYKGTLINRPGGPDVYKGCEIDYRHWEVGPRNFLHVLKGEKEELQRSTGRANAKVIDSGPEDHIFVTYTGLPTAPVNCLQDQKIVHIHCIEKQEVLSSKHCQLFLWLLTILWTGYSTAPVDCRQDQRIVLIDCVEKQEALHEHPQKITATHQILGQEDTGAI